jgi:hypothetical protein
MNRTEQTKENTTFPIHGVVHVDILVGIPQVS